MAKRNSEPSLKVSTTTPSRKPVAVGEKLMAKVAVELLTIVKGLALVTVKSLAPTACTNDTPSTDHALNCRHRSYRLTLVDSGVSSIEILTSVKSVSVKFSTLNSATTGVDPPTVADPSEEPSARSGVLEVFSNLNGLT